MNNLRMWAYAMIATGLINWDYQRAQSNILIHSLAIVVPGFILLIATFIPSLRATLQKKSVQAAWFIIGVAALAYAFIN